MVVVTFCCRRYDSIERLSRYSVCLDQNGKPSLPSLCNATTTEVQTRACNLHSCANAYWSLGAESCSSSSSQACMVGTTVREFHCMVGTSKVTPDHCASIPLPSYEAVPCLPENCPVLVYRTSPFPSCRCGDTVTRSVTCTNSLTKEVRGTLVDA